MSKNVPMEEDSISYDTWTSFGNILRNENRIIFHQMLEDIKTYSESAKSKGENFSFESMCMTLIIQQQKMINELLGKISKRKYDQFSLPS
jgi:hypothetical protein